MFVNLLAATNTQQQSGGGIDVMTIGLFAVFALLIFFMFRKQKKVQAQMREKTERLKEQMVPGTEVMTQFGLFGTVVSVDADNNKVVLELSPGNTATVHTQAVNEVVTPETPEVPDDASSLTAERADRPEETAEETLKRLNEEQNKDTK
ncbi:preprotein translocase subunit YajC [Arthrobacter sp.]|uniref:preprotein translocase subunit YajC n=1 Tax=Arthrobacter sp. TaxID=1667 RepID=UPI003396B3FF